MLDGVDDGPPRVLRALEDAVVELMDFYALKAGYDLLAGISATVESEAEAAAHHTPRVWASFHGGGGGGSAKAANKHPGSSFTAVYHVRVPNGCDAGLEFRDRRKMADAVTKEVLRVVAKPGQLLVFPSWLEYSEAAPKAQSLLGACANASNPAVTLSFNLGTKWESTVTSFRDQGVPAQILDDESGRRGPSSGSSVV